MHYLTFFNAQCGTGCINFFIKFFEFSIQGVYNHMVLYKWVISQVLFSLK